MVPSTYERVIPRNDPNRDPKWNWLDDLPYTLYLTNGDTHVRRLPWYEATSPSRPYLDVGGVNPKDGWVLIFRDFGVPGEGVDVPRFFLYNIFSGMLRCFFFNHKIAQCFTCAFVRLKLVNPRNPDAVPALLTYYAGNLLAYQENGQYVHSGEGEEYLDRYNPQREALAVTRLLPETWCHADFYLVGYDPDIGEAKYCDSGFLFEIIGVDETHLTCNGQMHLTPLYDDTPTNLLTDYGKVVGALPAGKVVGFLQGFLSTAESKQSDLTRAQSANNFAVVRLLQSLDPTKIDSFLGAVGGVMGFIGALIGGGSTGKVLEYKGDVTLQGTLETPVQAMSVFLRIPGVQRTGEDAAPFWAGTMGVFNLRTLPRFLQRCYVDNVVPDPMNENSTVAEYIYLFNLRRLQWVNNVSIPARLTFEAAPVALGSGVCGEYMPMESIQDVEWTYGYSLYIDEGPVSRRAGVSVRVTVTPHNAPPDYTPLRLYKVFVPVFDDDMSSLTPGAVVTLKCLDSHNGSVGGFLEGNRSDGTVRLSRSSGGPSQGTLWEVLDGGDGTIILECRSRHPMLPRRYLCGSPSTKKVGLAQSKNALGCRWKVVSGKEEDLTLRCVLPMPKHTWGLAGNSNGTLSLRNSGWGRLFRVYSW